MLNNIKYLIFAGCILVSIPFETFSQEKKQSIAIFSTDSSMSLGLISNVLRDLKNLETNIPLFGDIVDFNDLSFVNEGERNIRRVLSNFGDKQSYYYYSGDSIKAEIAKEIQKYDWILRISVNKRNVGEMYDFRLYPTIDSPKDTSNKPNPVWAYINSTQGKSSQAIIYKDTNIKTAIINALKNLFPSSHDVPKPIIKIDTEKLNGSWVNDTIYTAVGEKLALNAYSTIDYDTPKEALIFDWKLLPITDSLPFHDYPTIIGEGYTCNIIPNSSIPFEIRLTVFDGVERTKNEYGSSTVLTIIPKKSKHLKIVPREIKSFQIESLRASKTEYFVQNKKLLIENVDSNVSIEIDTSILKIDSLERNGDSLKLKIANINDKLNQVVSITSISKYGIQSLGQIKINHKVYKPYYFGINGTINQFELNPDLNINIGTQIWLEYHLMLYGKISESLDFGLGISFSKQKWVDQADNEFTLYSVAELELYYQPQIRYFNHPLWNFGFTAFSKLYQADTSVGDSLPFILGLGIQIELSLYQGLGELTINFPLPDVLLSKSFISDYDRLFKFGLKIYLSK